MGLVSPPSKETILQEIHPGKKLWQHFSCGRHFWHIPREGLTVTFSTTCGGSGATPDVDGRSTGDDTT